MPLTNYESTDIILYNFCVQPKVEHSMITQTKSNTNTNIVDDFNQSKATVKEAALHA